ncbi:MAG: Dihydrolipoyllysine-residue acetyltransferase component of pyruvate dehydrogenase complex [Smithella sp. PtaU1.Bin162]|nr:MAG: Dihydrolipoyllysine-residue acetyltransferase component of pyruvate dehydrogenase complex [Smithella sp. PtaU1.Bin162]
MATTIIMPKLGLTMTEGTIEKWLKKEGERVEKGEPLLKILTEKINFQYESPASGILRKVLYKEGAVVPVTTPIAIIAEEGEALPEIELVKTQTPSPEQAPAAAARTEAKTTGKRVFASPAAKKAAEEKGIDLSSLQGSGPEGRIVLADVAGAAGKATVAETKLKAAEKVIPLTGIRKIIAQRMTESFRDVPHFYLSVEVDMSAVLNLREKVKDEVEKRAKVKLTVTDILVKIVASALKNNPIMNSRFAGDRIHLLDEVNMGVAIALEDGLIVPVVRRADQKTLAEIASNIRNLTKKAKRGKLSLEDVTGGTFTLSNMGMLGIDMMSPIINPPECSILGVGRTIEKPVVEKGEIKIKPLAWLTLSSDHRIVDGAAAGFFLNRIRELIENPSCLLV